MKKKSLLPAILFLFCRTAFSQAPCAGTPTISYSGQIYNTVQIGSQCWLKENLNIGVQVSNITQQTNNASIEKACYNNTVTNCNTYGGIYTWDEAMNYTTNPQGICPNGWHIPTSAEFQTLSTFLGSATAGQKMKVTASNVPAWDGVNTSSFTALSGGIGQGTNFQYMGSRETFWSSTQFSVTTDAYDYDLSTGSNSLTEANNTKSSGYCIRCIMDLGTGIKELNQSRSIRIYPNPNNGSFFLKIENEIETGEIIIHNNLGQTVYKQTANRGNTIITIEELSPGMYFYTVLENKQNVYSGKLLIDK